MSIFQHQSMSVF